MSTPPLQTPRPVSAFIQLWTDAASAVLAQIASAPYPMRAAPGEGLPQAAAGDVHLTITASGTARGEMSLRIPPATALDLVRVFTANPDVAGPEPSADDRAAIEELFRQIAGHVVTAARPKGLDIQLTTILGEAPTWPASASGWIASGEGAPHVSQFEWKLSSALATALVTTWQHEPETPKPAAVTPAAIPEVKEAKPASATKLPSKLDLLMDVELEVMLRFGGRNILLKEILELGPGSVLELDRDIQDEADLFLDGKLIARGEVVAVEGNFGLRVTEVLARQGSS